MSQPSAPTHFKGKDAIGHVAEAQAQGIIDSAEIHGTEVPGHISAGADAARNTSIALLLTWVLLLQFSPPNSSIVLYLGIFGIGWLVWKTGRSAWLGWSRLERLHRVLSQEKWEIEHNRPQEKEELKELYAAKGFEGKLLDDVVDVLMADGDRLLKVMVEEELGLSLESHEHPLKQASGAAVGSFIALAICLATTFFIPSYGMLIGASLVISLAAGVSSSQARNRVIPAIIWNLGIATLSFGFVYFLLEFFKNPL